MKQVKRDGKWYPADDQELDWEDLIKFLDEHGLIAGQPLTDAKGQTPPTGGVARPPARKKPKPG